MVRQIEDLLKMTDVEYIKDYKTSKRCSLGAGGEARVAIIPQDEEELIRITGALFSDRIDFRVLGAMSNTALADTGFYGALIFTDGLKRFEINGDILSLGAGVRLPWLFTKLIPLGISGFEELFGIPGTVGGGVFQNAGSYGRECADIFVGARVYDLEMQRIVYISKSDMCFSYRSSILKKERSLIILSADFKVCFDDAERIRERSICCLNKRRASQPSDKSLGSTFKRPDSGYAGELIDKAGLKGARVGGACVSEKHAGFIINTGGSTVHDYTTLADICQSEVFKKFGIKLEREFEIIEN